MDRKQLKASLQVTEMNFKTNPSDTNKTLMEAAKKAFDDASKPAKTETATKTQVSPEKDPAKPSAKPAAAKKVVAPAPVEQEDPEGNEDSQTEQESEDKTDENENSQSEEKKTEE